MDQRMLQKRINVASGKETADCVIKNGKIIDVFNGNIFEGDIALVDGFFAGIGTYTGKTEIDAEGKYVSPSFIDGHVHIESSMVRPSEFAKALLVHGVTCVIADPHEIANVAGSTGIQYMLEQSEQLPFDFYFMLPSCVPATSFEHAGATLNSSDLLPFYQHPRVLGLAEVMNYPAVESCDADMLQKLTDANSLHKKIDGHAAGLTNQQLNVYGSAHITTDHESTTAKEAQARLRNGMYLMLREGTVAKDLINLLPAINQNNIHRCLFVTDDRHLDDIHHEGSIDYNVRLAIAHGIEPINAIKMASIHTAQCFGLANQGAIAPGYKADFLLLNDLSSISIDSVYKSGELVCAQGELIHFPEVQPLGIEDTLKNTVHFHELQATDFAISFANNLANIIEIIPNSLITKHLVEKVNVDDTGVFQYSSDIDHLTLAVIERHHHTRNIGLGIVKGLGLKSGAIATTVAHDSHNLIIAGTNNKDMAVAARTIKEMQGGLVVIQHGKVLASLSLPIAGLMSTSPYQQVITKLAEIDQALTKLNASQQFNPFLTLAFLALPVIPEIKLTDQGLFLTSSFSHIPIEAVPST
ncbi:adenine deaminase [Peribacillus asahii]|uniref:Adenine deaminase n=1 Tax=Peribacillus asahii TaxID=228899 RepID=A0A398B403_9BACI|nr:adenine deaminase [Peribacillus asahii]RID84321.1 adenine deaminase [Peribacillus asahii]